MRILVSLSLLIFTSLAYSQAPPAPTRTVTFSYDESGNRIQRYIQNPDYLLKHDSVVTTYGEGNKSDSFFISNFDSIQPIHAEEDQNLAIKVALEYNLNVYPNPTRNVVTVSSSKMEDGLTISVYDNSGKFIGSQSLKAGSAQVNLSEFADGIYHLFILLPDKERLHYKLEKVQ
jgi:hypothetical protein